LWARWMFLKMSHNFRIWWVADSGLKPAHSDHPISHFNPEVDWTLYRWRFQSSGGNKKMVWDSIGPKKWSFLREFRIHSKCDLNSRECPTLRPGIERLGNLATRLDCKVEAEHPGRSGSHRAGRRDHWIFNPDERNIERAVKLIDIAINTRKLDMSLIRMSKKLFFTIGMFSLLVDWRIWIRMQIGTMREIHNSVVILGSSVKSFYRLSCEYIVQDSHHSRDRLCSNPRWKTLSLQPYQIRGDRIKTKALVFHFYNYDSSWFLGFFPWISVWSLNKLITPPWNWGIRAWTLQLFELSDWMHCDIILSRSRNFEPTKQNREL
jgi:hypothetical protein